MKRYFLSAPSLLAFTLMLGCQGRDDVPSSTLIAHGEVTANENIAALYLQEGKDLFLCTSSLINLEPPVLLTAKHCVKTLEEDDPKTNIIVDNLKNGVVKAVKSNHVTAYFTLKKRPC